MKKIFFLLLIILLISGCTLWSDRYVNLTKNISEKTHLECIEGYCIQVSGEGINQCSIDLDCGILEQPNITNNETHLECVDKKCIEVSGKGNNKCSMDYNCIGSGGNGGDDGGEDGDDTPPIVSIPKITEFGLNAPFDDLDGITFTSSKLEDLEVHKIRIWENWIFREPSQNIEKWDSLDTRIGKIEENNLKVIITLKPTGITDGQVNWYCNPLKANENSCVFESQYEDDFRDYISNLTKRYSGKISKISFSNEWDSTYQFVGSAQDYVKYANWVYDITKNNSPATEVVLGPTTKWPYVIIAGCELGTIDQIILDDGTIVTREQLPQYCPNQVLIDKVARTRYVLQNAKYDMIDIHIYDDPENWDEYISAARTLTDKPIIVSEFGGPDLEDPRFDAYNETIQALELKKYLDKLIELEIPEAYFFTLIQREGPGINHPESGLMKLVNGYPEEKPTYNVFKEYTTGDIQPLFNQSAKTNGAVGMLKLFLLGSLGLLIAIIYLLSLLSKKK